MKEKYFLVLYNKKKKTINNFFALKTDLMNILQIKYHQ